MAFARGTHMQVFPVREGYQYARAFDERPGGHKGTDIFAPAGTEVLAVDSGFARTDDDPKGGNTVYLQGPDGTRYYYAHLQDYEGKFPRQVAAGEVLGRVGSTGNARGKAPHVHFQIFVPGHGVMDPFDELRRVDSGRGGSVLPDGAALLREGLGELGVIAVLALLWWLKD